MGNVKKLMVPILAAIIIVLLAIYYSVSNNFESESISESAKRVVIINFIDHPVLNKIENSIIESLGESYAEDSLEITTLTAQGRIEELPQILGAAIRMDPYVIVTVSTPVTRTVLNEISEQLRVVYTFVTDPSVIGAALNRTNNTGLSDAVGYSENLNLIELIFGAEAKIGFAYSPNEPNSVSGLQVIENLIEDRSFELFRSAVTSEADLPQAISRLLPRIDVLYIGGDNLTVGAFPVIERLATSAGVPIIASDSGSIEAGAIAGYSVDYIGFGDITADIISRVLEGTEPREIPRISIPGDKLIVNSTALDKLGVILPDVVYAEADEVL